MENSKEKRYKRPLGQLGTSTSNSKFLVGMRPTRSLRPDVGVRPGGVKPKTPIIGKLPKKAIETSDNE